MANSTHAAVSILIGADLGKSFRDSFGSANKQLSNLGDAIKKVNDKAAEIESFRKSSRATKEASLAYQEAKQKLNLLNTEFTATTEPSKALQNNFRRAEDAAKKAKVAFMESAIATREIGKALKNSGVDFKNLNQYQEKLNQNLENLKRRQVALQNNSDAKTQNLLNRTNYRAQMFDAIALGTSLYAVIKPAVNFEFAMARVGAVTEEAANSEGFKKLTAKARELGATTQYTATEAAKAMQFLGMAGFNTNQILAATPAILNLAIADNMELGESAQIVSNILNSFGMKAEEAGKASDILAQASIATSTSVRTLGETMKFVAPAASAVGGTLEETAALAGVLGNAGIDASMAGTMMRSAYLRLAAPARAGAKALGDFKDKMQITAEEMPDVAKEAILAQSALRGLGVRVFTSAGKMRPMVEILRDLHFATKKLSDKKKLGVVKDIFGSYATSGALNIFKAFDKGAGETGNVDQVLDKIKNSEGTAKSIADRLNDTATGAFRELDSSVESIGISFGNTLLPTISSAARTVANFASKISALAERFPVITQYIGMTITSLIGLKIALVAAGYSFSFLKGIFLNVTGGILKVITALKWLNVALLLNPIGLTITAIALAVAGLGAAAYFLVDDWKPVGEFFKNIFSGIVGWVKTAFVWVSKLATPLKAVADTATNLAGKAWNFITGCGGSKNTESVASSKGNMAENIVGNIVGNFTRGSGQDTAKLSPVEANNISEIGGNNSRSQITISAPITIHSNGNTDERKIADQVRIAIDETFRKLSARKLALNFD